VLTLVRVLAWAFDSNWLRTRRNPERRCEREHGVRSSTFHDAYEHRGRDDAAQRSNAISPELVAPDPAVDGGEPASQVSDLAPRHFAIRAGEERQSAASASTISGPPNPTIPLLVEEKGA